MKKIILSSIFVLSILIIVSFVMYISKNTKTENTTEQLASKVQTTTETEKKLSSDKSNRTETENHNLASANIEEKTSKEEPVEIILSETSWSLNVRDPYAVYDSNPYFAKIKVTSKEKDTFVHKSHPTPTGMYHVQVLDVIKGEELPENITISLVGGQVSRREYLNTLDADELEKSRNPQYTETELDEQILIADDAYYRLQTDKEYYVSFDKPGELDYYGFMVAGYAVFEERDGSLYNVITGEQLDINIG